MILSEPMVMERYGHESSLAISREEWTSRIARSDPFRTSGEATPVDVNAEPVDDSQIPEVDRTIYDTARRLWNKLRE